jgi:hypothetical protein
MKGDYGNSSSFSVAVAKQGGKANIKMVTRQELQNW